MFSTMKKASILITALIGSSLALPPVLTGPTCTEFDFPVTVSAENFEIPITGPLVYQQVSGTYSIHARYCEPQNFVKSRQNTLQVLVHGITYNRNYWSGDGNPGGATVALGAPYDGTTYSWIDYASQQGYPTLSIDRLGNGLSEYPDPVNVLQTPLQVEVNHQVITKARNGSLVIPNPRRFEKIAYIGHSYGSILGNQLNLKYPDDADVTILTGLNKVYNDAFIGAFVTALAPANNIDEKWAHLPSEYLAFFNQTSFEEGFYYPGEFDQGLINLDFELRGTVGVGELDSALALPPVVATKYRNPILDITGQHDTLFCTLPDPAQSTKPWKTYDCGVGKNASLLASATLYPNADYDYYAPSESGHCLNFHYSAQSTFAYAHNWLSEKSGL